jgi:hypothetical protein
MLNIDFYNIFININFDNILLEENNPLINSKEFYLNYKKIYFNKTNKNYSKFLRINSQLQRLNNTIYKITNNKYYYYNYLDKTQLDVLKKELKSIIISQKEIFNNFKHYVETLNKNVDLYSNTTTEKKRGILSFFNKSKSKPNTTLKRSKSNASTKSNKSVRSIQSFKSFME